MIKRKYFIILLGLSIILFCTGAVYAMESVEVTNHFETGIVDIELTEYQKNGDTEELWADKENILPEEEISKIPRIENDGVDCYVRAKITFRNTEEVDEKCLFGMDEQWMKADDGYYYYKEVLPQGSKVDIFRGVKIPKDFSQDNESESFYIDIDVDAIQSKNFTPEFETAAPWGSVEILACEKEGKYDINTFKQSDTKSFAIRYQGDAKKLVKNHEDFFSNFPYLMPGDVYSDSIELNNDSEDEVKLYFRSEALENSELLDKILLTITTDIGGKETIVYTGSLRAKELSEDIILGTINAKTSGKFEYKIEVPKELNNKYSILNSYVKWVFSTEPIEKEEDIKNTGDTLSPGFIICYLGIVLCIISVMGLRRTKKEGELEIEETNISFN